jgi:crotonobetainyl-CoA:carnitine CoA-transferase CaiB-like acyl-CoA transferase
MLPLEGVRVVSLEQAVAAPLATRQLADFGARVIKIERPGSGDFARGYDRMVKGMSAYFIWLNRSKESLTLDLKHREASSILEGLLEQADVFVQNLAPGAAERMDLSSRKLLSRYPRLIVCEISGFGSGGPYSDRKAYDLLVQCETGLVSITGTPETPCKVPISIADIAAGMYAFSGVLTALYNRERTGKGAALEVPMLEALGEWMVQPGLFAAYGGGAPPRTGARHASIYPYGPFATGDGKSVFFGLQNEREWDSFSRVVLGQPELSKDPRYRENSARMKNRHSLAPIIEERFLSLSAEQALELLDRAKIANARMNSAGEFWNHPQLEARGRWREIGSPVGKIQSLLPPVTFEGLTARMDAVPALGQQSRQILRELRYSEEDIDRLSSEGAI